MKSAEVADIFRRYSPAHKLPLAHLRTMHAIETRRTAYLGGHVNECGNIKISYNSCRNRHCPKCQFLKKEKWVEARGKELLPIEYFHVVFTLPDELNPLALRNRKAVYNILFKAASETLTELAKTRLGVQAGFITVLATWGQKLMDHPHLHCIVSGGGLSQRKWISLFPVKVMSRLFRGKFLSFLKKARMEEHLEDFTSFLKGLYAKEWVVYSKPPFNGPENVLGYLGRYTHRIAITNHRIIGIEDGKISFRWKDYADGNTQKVMALEPSEFIRRFLLHVLPDGLRHFGFLSNRPEGVRRGLPHAARCKGTGIATIRDVAGVSLPDHRYRCDPVSAL
jgi:hypothetical protein